MSYVDGFVVPVPTKNKQAYREGAAAMAKWFQELGATEVVERWGDDVPAGKVTDFQGAVKAKPDETVVFSWIVWPSKEVRDAANAKMKDDPRMNMADMPFDGQRLIMGGFDVIMEVHR